MMRLAYPLIRAGLFRMDPEVAHERSLRALERGFHPRASATGHTGLGQTLFGLEFPNPLGMAAGYDKDARVPDALLAMGFGFTEVGTVTPQPQGGNPRPRVFRLLEDEALINRLGFNSSGHSTTLANLAGRHRATGVVGVNIGANRTSTDRTADYLAGLRVFNAHASYFMVNISSPNTPGLRDLQAPAALDELLSRLLEERSRLAGQGGPLRPIVVKLAPDIAPEDLPAVVERLVDHGVAAICVSNTTLRRDGLRSPHAVEAGGLSGRPLFELSTAMLARIHRMTDGSIPLIGVGGIDTPERALAKIEAGASLLQLYTGLVYRGPALVTDILRHLAAAVRRTGSRSIADLVGTRSEDWLARGV